MNAEKSSGETFREIIIEVSESVKIVITLDSVRCLRQWEFFICVHDKRRRWFL